jgi:acetylglutamate kinase
MWRSASTKRSGFDDGGHDAAMTTVLKIGGELLEDTAAMRAMARVIQQLARHESAVVVHGGGRAIDADLRVRGIEPAFVDGLRITDAKTMPSVVSVLAGTTNTALVAALNAAGVRAVGLTGADAQIGLSSRVAGFTTTAGQEADLGLVGQPVLDAPVTLVQDLLALGYVPVIASIGTGADGTLLNVNADTLAGHLAASLRAHRLVVAGGTAGVLDANGQTIESLVADDIEEMTRSGAAHSGMVAKLAACRMALERGVADVTIVSGRGIANLNEAPGTRLLDAAPSRSARHA